MMHSNFPFARRPSLPFVLALLACAAIGCGRSADLFPDDDRGNDSCGRALPCAPEPSPTPDPEPCAGRACDGTTDIDTDIDIDDGLPLAPEPTLTDPELAQPSDGLPEEAAEPDPEPMPAGPGMPGPSDLPPEAPPMPLPEPAALDAGVGISVDAGVEAPPRGPGRPPRPERP